jgi:tRNA (guanine37-N1)-methyltransferase
MGLALARVCAMQIFMQTTILTLFPEAFPGLLAHSVVGRALQKGLWQLKIVNIRDYATDKHKTVDDTPYGGGAGMVLRADVVAAAIRAEKKEGAPHVVYLGPAGKRFTQADARRLAALQAPLVLLCGHYEGIDERVLEAEVDEVLSLGDFVLSGGEVAAQVVLDATVRLLPGVLGGDASLHEESFDLVDPQTGQQLVEYPHYTRPAVWEGHEVPSVLQGGNHAEIAKWRLAQARLRTARIKV